MSLTHNNTWNAAALVTILAMVSFLFLIAIPPSAVVWGYRLVKPRPVGPGIGAQQSG